jgi:hypothetical protein
LAKLSGRFSSRNKYFRISEVRIVRHFFKVFGKFGISKFPKFPNIRKNQFPKFPNFFWNYRTFPNFLPNFSKLFDQKTGFFALKPQILHHFFEIFEIYEIFELLPNFLPNLNFGTFFRTFSRKFHEFKNSGFFRKISELRKPNISETHENEKFGNFRLTQGLTSNPALPILVLNLPLNNNHLSTTANDHLLYLVINE